MEEFAVPPIASLLPRLFFAAMLPEFVIKQTIVVEPHLHALPMLSWDLP
jgi:hypothetical protein